MPLELKQGVVQRPFFSFSNTVVRWFEMAWSFCSSPVPKEKGSGQLWFHDPRTVERWKASNLRDMDGPWGWPRGWWVVSDLIRWKHGSNSFDTQAMVGILWLIPWPILPAHPTGTLWCRLHKTAVRRAGKKPPPPLAIHWRRRPSR